MRTGAKIGIAIIGLIGLLIGIADAGAAKGYALFVGVLAFYFLPALVADLRGAKHVDAIAAINLFLGWTLVGWLAALVWALVEAQPNPVESSIKIASGQGQPHKTSTAEFERI
jgi:Superinfection immunity protein